MEAGYTYDPCMDIASAQVWAGERTKEEEEAGLENHSKRGTSVHCGARDAKLTTATPSPGDIILGKEGGRVGLVAAMGSHVQFGFNLMFGGCHSLDLHVRQVEQPEDQTETAKQVELGGHGEDGRRQSEERDGHVKRVPRVAAATKRMLGGEAGEARKVGGMDGGGGAGGGGGAEGAGAMGGDIEYLLGFDSVPSVDPFLASASIGEVRATSESTTRDTPPRVVREPTCIRTPSWSSAWLSRTQ